MYSLDFRRLAMRILRREQSYRKAAAICKVSTSTLHRWRTGGILTGCKHPRGRPKRMCERALEALRVFLETTPVTTVARMQGHLHQQHGLRVSQYAIRQLLETLQMSRKRTSKRFSPPVDPVVQATRERAFASALSSTPPGNLVVSLDECYFSEKSLPLYGYARRGHKLVVHSPVASWRQRSLLLAVASDGSRYFEIFQGSVTGERFRAFLRTMPFGPGARVILDNASIHGGASASVFRDRSFTPLFTPPYSPQFNPVENVFSVVKGSFRAAWPWHRGVDEAIREAVSGLSADGIRGTFQHLQSILPAAGA